MDSDALDCDALEGREALNISFVFDEPKAKTHWNGLKVPWHYYIFSNASLLPDTFNTKLYNDIFNIFTITDVNKYQLTVAFGSSNDILKGNKF